MSDKLDPDFDEELENEDLDFDADEEFEDEEEWEEAIPSAPSDVYTALLLISLCCYASALVYTVLEMKPYCTEWMKGIF